jgi:hypothetical protein
MLELSLAAAHFTGLPQEVRMPLPRIAAVATATPKHRFDQAALLAFSWYFD